MSKEQNKTEEFNFNIDSLFGDFSTIAPGLTDTTEDDVDDVPKHIQDEIDKNQKTKSKVKDIKESDEDEDEEVEEDDSDEDSDDDEPASTKDSNADEESDDSDDSVTDEEDEDVEYSYKAIVSHLAEQGVIDFEDSDDIEDSPELLEKVVLSTAQNMVEEYKNSIPEEGKYFLEYLEKGGDPSKYIQTLEKPLDFENLDLDKEDVQKRVIKEYLNSQDYSKEEIEELIQDYEDGLLLAKQAKFAASKLEKIHGKKKIQLLAQQEEELKNRQKQIEEYTSTIKNTITGSKELGGLEISDKDKKDFEKYLLERSKDGLTQYERELQSDPIKTSIELAFLKFKKFDFSKIATKEKTKEAKRIKGLIKSKDTSVRGASRKISSGNKGGLDGFKSLL